MVENIKQTSVKKDDVTALDVDFVREKLSEYQKKIVHDVHNCLQHVLSNFMRDLHQHELQKREFNDFAVSSANLNNRQQAEIKETKVLAEKLQDNYKLPDKVFVTRESYLTALKGVSHIRILFHLLYQALFIFFIHDLCHDYFINGVVRLGFGAFKAGLVGIHYVFGIWLIKHIFVFALFYAFKCWANVYVKLKRQPPLQRFWSHSCLILHICAQLVFFYVAIALVSRLQLPYVSASILLTENCRLLMKMHAFVRTNVSRVLAGKVKTDADDFKAAALPTFSCYLYFLFAPTLIYRDDYPRTTHIRWSFALARLLEVVLISFVYAYIYERYMLVYFNDIGLVPLSIPNLLVKALGMVWPSITIFVCGFYLLLHAWLNFTAELMRFGDRLFYRDWWTSTNYDAYYRNWNIVVHDWLYEYIYKESYQHIFKGSKLIAALMVFYVSAIVHEIILGVALQIFFPVMFFSFGICGVAFVFVTRHIQKLGYFFVWCSLIYGNGIMIFLYCLEKFAQYNCPKTNNTWSDYLTPALLRCSYGSNK